MNRYVAALFFTIITGTANATEDDSVLWKIVGNWRVAADRTLGGSCFIATSFNSGTVLRLGFNQRDAKNAVHVIVANPDWQSIEVEKDYEVRLQLDKNPPWDAQASGVDFGGLKGLWINANDVNFVTEFVSKHFLHVFFSGKPIASMSLKDSGIAAREMAQCQNAIDENLSPQTKETPKDPFAIPAAPRNAKDPFAL